MTVYWPNGSLTIPRVSSEFDGARKNPVTGIIQPHNGIDIVGFVDNCSPVDGTVIFAGYNGGAGNEARIRADGPTAFHVGDHFRLLHNARLYVKTGQRVAARQPVGRMGTTGQSTGIHCHFETHEYRLWNYVNPRDFMARANAGTPAGGGDAPFIPKGFLMALSDAEQTEALALLREIKKRLRGENPDIDMLQEIRIYTAETQLRVRGPKPDIDMLQDILGRVGGTVAPADVDEDALAARLAPTLAPLLVAHLGTLSDETIADLAERVVDEQARRLTRPAL